MNFWIPATVSFWAHLHGSIFPVPCVETFVMLSRGKHSVYFCDHVSTVPACIWNTSVSVCFIDDFTYFTSWVSHFSKHLKISWPRLGSSFSNIYIRDTPEATGLMLTNFHLPHQQLLPLLVHCYNKRFELRGRLHSLLGYIWLPFTDLDLQVQV